MCLYELKGFLEGPCEILAIDRVKVRGTECEPIARYLTTAHRAAVRAGGPLRLSAISGVASLAAISFLFLALVSDRAVAGDPPPACTYYKLLVSAFNADNIKMYDGCDGTYLGNFDTGGHLDGPQGITRGLDGHLYVCSEGNNRIVKYDGQTGAFISNFVVDDPGTPMVDETGGLDGPTAVAFDGAGNLYVASFNSDSVLKYSGVDGSFIEVFVTPGDGGLDGPDVGMTFGPDHNLYVPSFWNNQVMRYALATGDSMGPYIEAADGVVRPRALVFRESVNELLVAAEGGGRVRRHNATTGDYLGDFTSTIANPCGMAYGPDGNAYVSSSSLNLVRRADGTSGATIDNFVPSGLGGLNGATFVYFWGNPPTIPTVSEWGLVVISTLLLAAGTLMIRHRA